MKLFECAVGATVRVVTVDLPDAHARRLRELGLAAGHVVHVTHRAAFGGRVVMVESDRFALDRATARRLEVEPVETALAEAAPADPGGEAA